MTNAIAGFLHGVWRLLVLVAMLTAVWAETLLRRRPGLRAQAGWRQKWCRRIVWALRIPVEVSGSVPSSGLIVSNHLTYLDVLAFGAVFDGVFVAKQQVRAWPLIGCFTAAAGTIYIDRESARSAAAANRRIVEALAEGLPVLVFPEGTTSSGEGVLPFQSPLFEAAVKHESPVWPAAIHYTAAMNATHQLIDVPYWGDMTFVPHLVRALRAPGLRAHIDFAEIPLPCTNRRIAAAASHEAVERLYNNRTPRLQAETVSLRPAVAPWLREPMQETPYRCFRNDATSAMPKAARQS